MRFYFQDAGQKVATKCIRVASDATVTDVIGNPYSRLKKLIETKIKKLRFKILLRIIKILTN